MGDYLNLNVRVGGALKEHVAEQTGEFGRYDNASEYVRDLIRHDQEQRQAEAVAKWRSHMEEAFAQPRSAYKPFDREAFFERMRQKHGTPDAA